MKHLARGAALAAACTAMAAPAAAENRIDGLSPDAPDLAAYGPRAVGVRTFEFTNPEQVDVVNIDPNAPAGTPLPTYDRDLTVEMWYPALAGATGDTTLDAYIRDGATQVELEGRAVRDAPVDTASGAAPLVILSHGHPGNRYLMSHLAENIASKGYVVASIDHTDSTYRDQPVFDFTKFQSTLVNRPLDQTFVLDEIGRADTPLPSDLAGVIDAGNTALIGYSMGGYGALVTAGGGLTTDIVNSFWSRGGALGVHEAGSATHDALPDPRIRTAVAIGPWGRQDGRAFWDAAGLSQIDIPLMIIGGSADDVSMYEDGIRRIWAEASGAERALLTFEGGSHNTVAPIPAPDEAFAAGVEDHYVDAAFDSVFMNDVGQHFVTAWLDARLKGDADAATYLDLPVSGSEGWRGFRPGTADALTYETLAAGQFAPVPLPASVLFLGAALGGLGLSRRRAVARRAG